MLKVKLDNSSLALVVMMLAVFIMMNLFVFCIHQNSHNKLIIKTHF